MQSHDAFLNGALALLVRAFGAIVGTIASYFLVGAIYLTYADYYPLDPSAECSRGGGVAWLSIFSGMLIGFIFSTSNWLKREE